MTNNPLSRILKEDGTAFGLSETRSLNIVTSRQFLESTFFIVSCSGKILARFGNDYFHDLKSTVASEQFLLAGSDHRVLRIGSDGNTEYFSKNNHPTSIDPSLILTASLSTCEIYIVDPTISHSLCRFDCPVKHLPFAMNVLLKHMTDKSTVSKLIELYSFICPELDFTSRSEVTDVE